MFARFKWGKAARLGVLAAVTCSLFSNCAAPPPENYQISSVRSGAGGTKTSARVNLRDGGSVDLDQLVHEIQIIARRQASAGQRETTRTRAKRSATVLARSEQGSAPKSERYLVVETERDTKSVGAASVMVWDTYSSDIVGNEVFDIKAAPAVGELVRFQTFSAEYVGKGI